ncbi:tetratricopeptide repeat protein [bacterium]|nr:tetratricopeptide repeat protein [bacterium]
MDYSILVVDFAEDERCLPLFESWQESDLPIKLKLCSGLEEAELEIESEDTVGMIISTSSYTPDLDTMLRSFQTKVGCLPDFISIICDEPSPRFLVSVFEFGVETIFSFQRAQDDMIGWVKGIASILENEESPEANAIALSRGIKTHDAGMIAKAGEVMSEMAEYDYKAAFVAGKALEVQGDFAKAELSYRTASNMNKMFRPTTSSLGETLLINGKTDEAIAIFEKLEKSNPRDMMRKSNLIAAYVESGDLEKANAALAQAESQSADHPKVKEAKAHILLSQGKVSDAFGLMDELKDAGPLFASKLNDLGIRLSKGGKAKSALALYNKSHKIVRQDLKYKVTLNAALACRRAGAYEKALKYLMRCEKEYGSMFPKLKRIVDATKQAVDKKKKLASKQAS